MSREPLPPQPVLAAWGLEAATLSPLGRGLINQTWLARCPGGRVVLQQVNPMFPPSVNADIDTVTAHLAERGLRTPRLLRTREHALWLQHLGQCWRALSWIPGESPERVSGPAMAAEAGRLLGRFHAALADLDHEFSAARTGIHDTARHLAALGEVLATQRQHPAYQQVASLGDAILAASGALVPLPRDLPLRVVHGDPKLNNLLFDPLTGLGICLVDLDTLGRMEAPLELGDALRSWSNPGGEDSGPARFELELFEAALRGYAAGSDGLLTAAESGAVTDATATIMLELAARFCADALNESYFGWDPARYASRGEHNLARARRQFALFGDFSARQERARLSCERIFAAG